MAFIIQRLVYNSLRVRLCSAFSGQNEASVTRLVQNTRLRLFSFLQNHKKTAIIIADRKLTKRCVQDRRFWGSINAQSFVNAFKWGQRTDLQWVYVACAVQVCESSCKATQPELPGGAREVSINSTPWNCDYDERFKSLILPSKLSLNAPLVQNTFLL